MTETKEERLYTLLKSMANYETRSFEELAKDIGVSTPTLRDFMAGKYSKKTLKMVETWFKTTVQYLSEVYTHYRRVEDDDE